LKIEKYASNCYKIPRYGKMQVEARIYLNDYLYQNFLEKEALKQLCDAASLPGVYQYVIGMPDIHSGYGLPIGGVMAMEVPDGLISAGAVGMDINCGVRLLRTKINTGDLSRKDLEALLLEIASRVPTGIGKTSKHQARLGKHFAEIIECGFETLLKLGYARPEDCLYIEEEGFFPGADLSRASKRARKRGNQLSTIGGGNHFIELGRIAEIYDQEGAALFKLTKGNLSILIHTGVPTLKTTGRGNITSEIFTSRPFPRNKALRTSPSVTVPTNFCSASITSSSCRPASFIRCNEFTNVLSGETSICLITLGCLSIRGPPFKSFLMSDSCSQLFIPIVFVPPLPVHPSRQLLPERL
jgi:hypothetical protein